MEVDKVEKQSAFLSSQLGKLRSSPLQDTVQPLLTVMQKPALTKLSLQLQRLSKYRLVFQSTQPSSFSAP
eukprot:13515987-Ditylum_brightwellii.AAC.1